MSENKASLWSKIPPITYNDVRRIREPFVALLKEQIENGYPQTAAVLETFYRKTNILQTNHNSLNSNKIHTIFLRLIKWLNQLEENSFAILTKHGEQLHDLRSIFSNLYQINDEIHSFGPDFESVCEDIFLLTLNVAQKLKTVDDELLVNIYFQIGHFYHRIENYQSACNCFEKANILCRNKKYAFLESNINEELDLGQQICIEFCSSIMGAASRKTNLGETKRLAIKAIEIAEESNDDNTIGEAQYFLGGILQKIECLELSCRKFDQSLESFQKTYNSKRQCAAHLNLARNLNYLNQNEQCINHIEAIIEISKAHNYLYELAEAYDFYAEVNEKNQHLSAAVDKYNIAVEIYNKLNMKQKATDARCSGANCLVKSLIYNMADMRIKMNGNDETEKEEEELENYICMER